MYIRPSTHTHPCNCPLSRTTQVSRYQKGKTNLDFTEARDSEWQWHQLAIYRSAPCSRQITTPASHHSVFTGRMPFLPPNQQRQSTEGKKSLQRSMVNSLRVLLTTFDIVVSILVPGVYWPCWLNIQSVLICSCYPCRFCFWEHSPVTLKVN